ncbi:heparinase II/III domain-containing protein [Ferdinandcohnia sp. SAFN-114]|uniref:heparinase II/III domain-containing protein n=1 Tax=Ferdinandcohnia sp. SAFN-114 TaxID=3387275 RepID=UPI003F7E533A
MDLYIPKDLTEERALSISKALPGSRNKDCLQAAKNITNKNAYAIPPFGTIQYPNLIDWDDNRSRAYSRLIHGFTFLGCLTDAFVNTGDIKYLEKGMALIKDWIGKHTYETKKETMAYHDETTALRLQYWQKYYIYAKGIVSNDEIEILEERMWITAALLEEDSFHSTGTNHGMFQDIALLLFSIYFEGEQKDLCNRYKNISVTRLKDYFKFVFTKDGVHKEHSPSYHLLIVSNIKALVDWMEEIDQAIAEEFSNIYLKAMDYATYIIRPDGYLPPICDTEAKLVRNGSARKLFDSEEYLYSVTSGEKGIPPQETDKVFPEAGYAIFRDDWNNKEDATYVLFAAAYNTNYHKHSDDLNLYIYSKREIITEAGPNGYNYKDPFTKYAYSSFAHNTLIVDGIGLPRTDGNYEGVYLSDYKIAQDISEATGINRRYEGVEHKRRVVYKKWLC